MNHGHKDLFFLCYFITITIHVCVYSLLHNFSIFVTTFKTLLATQCRTRAWVFSNIGNKAYVDIFLCVFLTNDSGNIVIQTAVMDMDVLSFLVCLHGRFQEHCFEISAGATRGSIPRLHAYCSSSYETV